MQVEDASHGHFTVLALGTILTDIPGYHAGEHVYPVGFKGLRTIAPQDRAPAPPGEYIFEIRYGGLFPTGGAIFAVEKYGSSPSPTAAMPVHQGRRSDPSLLSS